MRNQTKEVILLHIIVPEYEIVPGYVSYSVALKDGTVEQGMIAAENPATITLRRALGEELTIGRANIAALASSGLSLMPQGLEANMSRQDMADLLAYLKGE
jgi:putative heme-binding domain-containing protein